MLLPLDGDLLLDQRPSLEALAKGGKTSAGRQMGYAALMNSRFMDEAWSIAGKDPGRLRDLLGSVSALTSESALARIYERFQPFLDSENATLRDAAIQASTNFPNHGEEVFSKLVSILESGSSTHAVIQAMHRMHTHYWHQGILPDVARKILEFAEGIPADDRNKAPFLDAVQLVQEMTKKFKQRNDISAKLAELQVPVIRIGTIKHQLKFDKTSFAVDAGKQIEVIFENTDILPHNLLLAYPGALEEIGALADKMALQPDGMSKHFVPDSEKVLMSTKLLAEGKSETLKLKVPDVPGEYLYICTFPGHWRTMYGKMIVK